ncbi:MAG TPA: hypothetical protein VHW93_09995 [Acidimicrobiales bacterium]|nr:hypothetical protein [Acidimicrobiales bacterium]
MTESVSPRPEDPAAAEAGGPGHRHDGSVVGLADYVYGTISTLVAIAGLTFENTPNALTAAGVVVVGAVAIWLAHGFSQLVIVRPWQQLELRWSHLWGELRSSWTIVSAAIPATLIFVLAHAGLWTVRTGFALAEIVGVLALAVVGLGTAGRGTGLSWRRVFYVGGLVLVGVFIVLLELLVHVLVHEL